MYIINLALLIAASVTGLPDGAETENVIAPGATIETLWKEGEFTEGPVMAGDGSILFSDIGDRIMRFDPRSGATAPLREPSGRANGLIFDGLGRLIAAEGANTGGGRRISITEPNGKIRTLADRYQGKRFNSPNDVAVDRQGRVYFSDPRYVGREPRELNFEAVFRVDPDGTVTRLETGATKPNGVVVSPDGKRLYIADNGRNRALRVVDLDDGGNASNPRLLQEGLGIDGMTVTTDGRIVAAGSKGRRSGVTVLNPEGKTLAVIPVPDSPTNVEFAGPEGSTLYITAGKSLYRIRTTMTGFRLWPSVK